jgi:hypothetical protein
MQPTWKPSASAMRDARFDGGEPCGELGRGEQAATALVQQCDEDALQNEGREGEAGALRNVSALEQQRCPASSRYAQPRVAAARRVILRYRVTWLYSNL